MDNDDINIVHANVTKLSRGASPCCRRRSCSIDMVYMGNKNSKLCVLIKTTWDSITINLCANAMLVIVGTQLMYSITDLS